MKLKVNDNIIVISGKNKGKVGKILVVDRDHNMIVVEKVNLVTKHKKKRDQAPGQKIQKEAPLHASKVMILDPKTNKPTRIGYRILKDGSKERYAKKSGQTLA